MTKSILLVVLLQCTFYLFGNSDLVNQPRTYIALKSISSLVIDGKADEPDWDKAEWSSDFVDIEGIKTPKYETRMKMLWDEDNLYIYAYLTEPHVWGNLTKRDTVIFYNNDFEVFIDPEGDTQNYYELEVNALNTIWDLFLTKPYRNGGKAHNEWDVQGLKSAVHVDGSLNDASDQDDGWGVELAIPWKAFTKVSEIPKNQFWRINFSRVQWDFDLQDGSYTRARDVNGKIIPEKNWVWSPQGVVNMHLPEEWGYVFFSDDDKADFLIPKDDDLKRNLYETARKIWSAEKKKVKKELINQLVETFMADDLEITPILSRSGGNWAISLISPYTERELIVHNDGRFEAKEPFKLWTWTTANLRKTDEAYHAEFKKYASNGVDAVLINTGTDPDLLRRLVPIAAEYDLEVHAWMFTVNRPGDKIAEQHPEWYAVSRDGKSCFDDPPYVGYYKWMCPTREASKNHILSLVRGLAEVEGVASVHLDYIRYSDIFLPIGLLPKYNLEQESELPRYDFCYCEVCAAEFEKIHHKNPRKMSNPAVDIEWKNFRLNKVKAIVDEAYKIAHEHGKQLTAAVFSYPEMAGHMVRQRWDKWKVDVVLPMMYHNFYNEEVDWIGYATKQGVKDLEGKVTDLHSGIYVPGMSADELEKAIKFARDNGAKGASFFDGNAITEEQWEVIRKF